MEPVELSEYWETQWIAKRRGELAYSNYSHSLPELNTLEHRRLMFGVYLMLKHRICDCHRSDGKGNEDWPDYTSEQAVA